MPIFPSILAIFAMFFIIFLHYFKDRFSATLPSILLNYYRIHDKITEILEENNGSFLFKLSSFGARDMLATSNPADIQHIMSTNFANYPKGPEWKKRFDIFGNGSFNTDFDEWMGHRKSIRLFMSHQKFKRFIGRIVQECITKELIPVLDIVSEKEIAVDFKVLIKWFISYISFSISTGQKPLPIHVDRLEDDPLTKAFDDACEAIFLRHLIPVPLWKLMEKLGIGVEKKYSKAWETIDCIFAHYASICQEETRKVTEQDGNRDVDEEDFNALNITINHAHIVGHVTAYNIIRDNIMSLIFASGDTTSTTLSWFFWLLSKNPNAEAKIRQELNEVSPLQKSEIKEFFLRNSKELEKMVYLEAAIKETLRLYPPVPYEARSPINPDILPSGHQVGEKMTIAISAFGLGRMKSLWGEDSHEFKPERWITQDGKIRHVPSHKFFAFSSGPRICPGKDYAYVLLKTFVATIMQNFHVQVVENQHVIPKTSVILQQKDGPKVMITKIARSAS